MEKKKKLKESILIFLDILSINVAFLFGFIVRYDLNFPIEYIEVYLRQLPMILLIYLASLNIFKIYKISWCNASVNKFIKVVFVCTISGILVGLLNLNFEISLPKGMFFFSITLVTLMILGSRLACRIYTILSESKALKVAEQDKRNSLVTNIREVDLRDLLGRDEIILDKFGVSKYLGGKTVLITGGGGSIGSELCRQIANFNPKKLLILDIYENNAYDLQNELNYKFRDLELITIIASVRDRERIRKIFKEFKPEIIFHAAAHKHVPLMEYNPEEAIKNNVIGTLNVAEAADKFSAEKFVLISTDKAVNPTNVMGATKRLCEMIIQGINYKSKTEFVAVRFGNVLGSNGSVIPLFKEQIKNRRPITLTHKEITRYFMLVSEAAQLVLQAGVYAKGGEIFVLDMGEPVKIYDLAKNLIKFSGLEIDKDIKIEIVGLRPGEKLYEELLINENLIETENKKIFIEPADYYDYRKLRWKIIDLTSIAINDDKEALKKKLKEVVPTFKEPNEVNIKEKLKAI